MDQWLSVSQRARRMERPSRRMSRRHWAQEAASYGELATTAGYRME